VEDIMIWDPDHIDFISEYCDRWCERCPLTDKCAAFTRESDPEGLDTHSQAVEEAMEQLRVELAFPEPADKPWLEELSQAAEPTRAEQEELDRAFESREEKVRNDPIMIAAHDYSVDAYTWLKLYGEATRTRAAAVFPERGDSPETTVLRLELVGVLDALEVVRWDTRLIPAKLRRALGGKADGAEVFGDDPAQTDWNGSAKLTLILTERSEAGWRLIARWAPESEIAIQLADSMAALRDAIERAFPLARRFTRPGFDEMPT
jgi:hypothetical protein